MVRHLGPGFEDAGALPREPFEYLVIVCDDANDTCPVFPGARERLHWSFEDPSRAEGKGEERLAVFRQVRDEIEARAEGDLMNGEAKT
jgi:arsenate reductase (thioredoxin)